MEKIIVIAPKQEFQNIRLLISGMAKRTVDVLLIDPKDTPNYEEIIKEANTNLICTLDDKNIEEKLRNSIEEFNRTLKFEHIPHVEVDTKKLIDTTPWYDRFLKKWDKYDHQPSKPNSKKKWNKRK